MNSHGKEFSNYAKRVQFNETRQVSQFSDKDGKSQILNSTGEIKNTATINEMANSFVSGMQKKVKRIKDEHEELDADICIISENPSHNDLRNER